MKTKVLFICVHNSGRSQIAEAYMNALVGDRFEAQSAGFNPTTINPLVTEVMLEDGIDLSGKTTSKIIDLFKDGKLFDYIVTVCDESQEAECPVFPGLVYREHWPFQDPESLTGSKEEKLAQLRTIRDDIKARILKWTEALASKDAQAEAQ